MRRNAPSAFSADPGVSELQYAAMIPLKEDVEISIQKKIGATYINWQAVNRPFDYDRVEIRTASEEMVERFVVQRLNDTDTWRQAYVAKAPFKVSQTNRLSENAQRLLRRVSVR